MTPVQPPSIERRLWNAYEPVHALCYFDPEFPTALARGGLTGWWNAYFAGRAAPLGSASAPVVTALFFGFAPAMVDRAIPKIWGRIDPAAALRARFDAATTVLGGLLTDVVDPAEALRVTEALEDCVATLTYDGRALAAAWAAVERPESLAARLWLATTVLREHRGDGHVVAATARGVTGLQAMLTHIGAGQVPRRSLQANRGWSDEEWQTAHAELLDAGVLDEDGRLTDEGVRLRQSLEDDTDRLAAGQVTALPDVEGVIDTLNVLGRAIVDRGIVPVPNPIGLARP